EDRTTPATFLVTNTFDSGAGSLRQAILDANNTANVGGPDRIEFNIPTTDPGYQSATDSFRLRPATLLPAVGDPAVIDGYTQPGASVNTLLGVGQLGVAPGNAVQYGDNAVLKIELDGGQVPPGWNSDHDSYGFALGHDSTVCGLVINHFTAGIRAGDNVSIKGNFIGT